MPLLHVLCSVFVGIATLPLPAISAPDSSAPSELSLHPEEGHSIATEGESATIDLRSERGIGRTALRASDGKWPKKLILRLHLRGLEHFEISNGAHALATSVGSTKDAPVRKTHVTEGAGPARLEVENQVGEDHPLFLGPRRVVRPKHPDFPQGAYFEIEVPSDLLKSHPGELLIRWIDFYR